MSAPRSRFRILDVLALLAVIFVVCVFAFGPDRPPAPARSAVASATDSEPAAEPAETQPKLPTGTDAYYLARRTCQEILKAPSTAKFSNPNSDANTGWAPDGYLQWKAFGTVEAQNTFGAMLRQNWSAVVQYNTGKLDVVYLQLANQEFGKRPPMRLAPVQP